jgi:RNA polymerase sigma-70 factor (ECF subfamily)
MRRLFDEHFDALRRLVRRLALPGTEVDDVVQAVLTIAARRRDAIEPGKERAFLFGTALRVIADMRKSASRRYEIVVDEVDALCEEPAPDERLDMARAQACIEDVIASMPEDLRTVFVLFELEDMTMHEISKALEVPPGTVASRLRRSRAYFEAAIAPLRERFADK